MLGVDEHGAELATAAARRSDDIVGALDAVDADALRAPSELPGWSRLTIACHLRYGAAALTRMTREALAGRPTAYYPDGRDAQRPGTLVPAAGESGRAVVVSLGDACQNLAGAWAPLDAAAWATVAREPQDNTDLGTMSLGVLAMARLTEVEVHGTDLGIGLEDWSQTFVDVALPARLSWLATRRSNHRSVGRSVRASWLLVARGGPKFVVDVDGDTVRTQLEVEDAETDFTIEGTARDVLATLLGRPTRGELVASPEDAVALFQRALPGP